MDYELSFTESKMLSFFKRNVPEAIFEDEDLKVLFTLAAIIFARIADQDDEIKSFIDIDKVPAEYLEPFSALIGYTYDPLVPVELQRIYMKKFLSVMRLRGTPLAMKLVSIMFAQNSVSLYQSLLNNIDVIEYDINDQGFELQEGEEWLPGMIAITSLDNFDIVKQKILEVLPAGVKLAAIRGILEIIVTNNVVTKGAIFISNRMNIHVEYYPRPVNELKTLTIDNLSSSTIATTYTGLLVGSEVITTPREGV